MALIYIDSCGDTYATADLANRGWSGSITVDTAGRNGSKCIKCTSTTTAQRALSSQYSSIIAGFAFKSSTVIRSGIFAFYYSNTAQCAISIYSNGAIGANYYNGSQVYPGICTSIPGLIRPNVWNYVETKILCSTASTGSAEIRLNGNPIPVASASSVRTTYNQPYITDIVFDYRVAGNGSPDRSYDDLYICDTTGTVNNDFLGDYRVYSIVPTADGHLTAWTPNSGVDQFSRVNQTTNDNDTTYIGSATTGNISLVSGGSISTIAVNVKGVQSVLNARKDDAGVRKIAPVVSNGVGDTVGPDITLGTTYSTYYNIYDLNPITGVGWTVGDVNKPIQMGAKVTL